MPVDSQGRYHMNPAMARMNDRASLRKAAKPEPRRAEAAAHEPEDEHKAVVKIEFHHHPEGGGKLQSVTHHADGHAEEADHENVHDAADHLTESMGDAGDEQNEMQPEMGDDDGMTAAQ